MIEHILIAFSIGLGLLNFKLHRINKQLWELQIEENKKHE